METMGATARPVTVEALFNGPPEGDWDWPEHLIFDAWTDREYINVQMYDPETQRTITTRVHISEITPI